MREAVSYIILKKNKNKTIPSGGWKWDLWTDAMLGTSHFPNSPFIVKPQKFKKSVPLTCYLENTHFLLSFFTSTYPSVFGCAGKDKVISVTFNIIGKNNKNIVKQLQVRLKWVH